MGNQAFVANSVCNYEDVQRAISRAANTHALTFLINTLPSEEQSCLIKETMIHTEEESIINSCISKKLTGEITIIVYGRNAADVTVHTKYKQLRSLGFERVYVYLGGMFEWLLLQDVYDGGCGGSGSDGGELFPTTMRELDILKYRSAKLNV